MLSSIQFAMIVNRLPHLMASQGISIRALSSMTGITYTTIRAVYHSQRRSVQLEVIDAICKVMEIQPGDIYAYMPDGAAYQEPGRLDSQVAIRPETPDQNTAESKFELIDGWKNW